MRLVSLLFLVLFFGVLSCSKEKSFEAGAPARGSLQSNAGECLPKIVAGSFIAGTALTDSNYIEVDVDVASAGSYTIKTAPMNGYSFSGSGNFTKTGINRVRLIGSGTPAVAGQDPVSIFLDSTSSCLVPVTVLPTGSNSGPAVFTLQKGLNDSCMSAAVSGTYAKGIALGGANTVAINVAVTTVGTYTVTTNTMNGFSFSGSGTLTSTGQQTITLNATGTPTAEGPTAFTVTAGGSTCSFLVTVTAAATPPPVGSGDLFPLTAGSYWTYDVPSDPPPYDTIKVANRGPKLLGGKSYQFFESNDVDGPFDSGYFRKSGNDYFEYVDLSETYPIFDNTVTGEALFLKENLSKNATWNADFTGPVQGMPTTLRFVFTCIEANTTETINQKSFSNVYKITATIRVGLGGQFTDLGVTRESHYAKGVGLIYEKITQGQESFDRKLRYWQVN